jgi:hypothetical protein
MRASFRRVSVVRVEIANGDDLVGRFRTWCRDCSIASPLDDAREAGGYVGYHTSNDAQRIRSWLADAGIEASDDGVDALVRLASELVVALESVALPEDAQRAERRLRACLGGKPCEACGAAIAGIPCAAEACPWR